MLEMIRPGHAKIGPPGANDISRIALSELGISYRPNRAVGTEVISTGEKHLLDRK